MSAKQSAETLRAIAERLSLLLENYEGESVAIQQAAELIEVQQRALEAYARIRATIIHSRPELTGEYFICGGSEVDERLGVPERVEICPAMGSDVVYIYERTDRSIVPEW